jgi:hypothetical protein
MTSKSLFVTGMKTESEFSDVYLDFIRQNGIPFALRRDNTKSEMSQRVKQIHTKDFCLKMNPSHVGEAWDLISYSDSDWAGDPETRVSVTGFIIYLLFGTPIC